MKPALLMTTLLAGLAVVGCATQSTPVQTAETVPAETNNRVAVQPVQAGDSYYETAYARVKAREAEKAPQKAKNVILFVGDGMGISTITAGRIYAGQKQGLDGESYQLAFEQMPNVALSKTYSNDAQISDSASTATALVSGVKVNSRTLGLTKDARYSNCASSEGNAVQTIFELAEAQGLATGVVSTARITHATPGSTYTKSANRDWEDDASMGDQAAAGCADIARQLIDWPAGDGFEVVLGGGRRHFLPSDAVDPEYADQTGRRADGANLIDEWTAKSDDHVFVYDQAGFDAIDFKSNTRVLGLFEPSHMQFNLDRTKDSAGEPTLAELTRAAIDRVSMNDDGFVLMIEAGRIDHGHHAGNAKRALEDVYALDEAVKMALSLTDPEETLIIVTADHSHVFTMAGYAARGNPILGKSAYGIGSFAKGGDGLPYTTLGYMNGPGAVCSTSEAGEIVCNRPDITDVDTEADDYQQQALIPMGSETHGGEDVAFFATGPGSELVSGVMEQNEAFQVMAISLGLIE
ncbi:alkaline phosphatase [Ponticaulis profundi]|uniref:Alkaline phosphatase n=1 Tax=Ponticaulis profundi TaxID=2665222 RepID=A0ABW1S7J8_9PROT